MCSRRRNTRNLVKGLEVLLVCLLVNNSHNMIKISIVEIAIQLIDNASMIF